ncbi:MAG TPA: molybdate ABC transporter substrate-binding protein [Caulobacteraceae bacterium]|jgi:molybdate transport system substrate-binding protein
MAPEPTRRAVISALAISPSFALAQGAPPLTVFAAASLKESMDAAGRLFSARTGKPARFSYGASSALARQIEQGAPADVFISADVDWMDYLSARHLIVEATRRDLFSNHLALIAPANSPLTLPIGAHMPLLRALGGGRLAIAGADVPAGRYGRASLAKLGVWDEVKDHLAPAENVRAALAFVARGETPLGIVYDTDAKVEPKVRIVGLFPDRSHPPIVYPGAVVAASRHPAARAFLDGLKGAEEAAVFRKAGFTVLGSRP